MPANESDPVAEQLAEALPDLSHTSGQRVWLTGLAGDKMRRTRQTCAEAIVAWLRKASADKHRCILCGVADGEIDRANQRAADAWEQADTAASDLRRTKNVLAQLEAATKGTA